MMFEPVKVIFLVVAVSVLLVAFILHITDKFK